MQQRLDAASASSATAHTIHTEEEAALQVAKDELHELRTRLVEQQGLVAKVMNLVVLGGWIRLLKCYETACLSCDVLQS